MQQKCVFFLSKSRKTVGTQFSVKRDLVAVEITGRATANLFNWRLTTDN